ncbi:CARDB domain-containing protein [Methanothermococcus okinawensis]|uniref:CARDB domain-containing protein n=1 Tax=Methanothermococcus okinawensis (strain DSM 14208 / JCM 11175 / IH1) TaxID=647113 RepID=F8AL61_METOI|nr:CARDB domain-containing protein [Methanothermococcus okinawensis]AEH06476.1 hypothetical protein Metok_0494 [Methanothermococcus okinawensis IH1]
MKKLFILAILGLISMACAYGENMDTISIGSGIGNIGDNVTIPLNVNWMGNDNTTLNAVIYYDVNGVELININTISNTTTSNGTSGSIGYIKLTTTNGKNAGLINLANLTFKIIGNGSGLTAEGCKNYTWTYTESYYDNSTNTTQNISKNMSECYQVKGSLGAIKVYPDITIGGKTCKIDKLVLDNKKMESNVVNLKLGNDSGNVMSIFGDYMLLINSTYNTKDINYFWKSEKEFNDTSYINCPMRNNSGEFGIYVNNSNGSMLVNRAEYTVYGNFYSGNNVWLFGKNYTVINSSSNSILLGNVLNTGVLGSSNYNAYIGEYRLYYTGGSYNDYVSYNLYKNGAYVSSGTLHSGDVISLGDKLFVVNYISGYNAYYTVAKPKMNLVIGADFNGYTITGMYGNYFDGYGVKFVKVINQPATAGMVIPSPTTLIKAIFDTNNSYHYECAWKASPFKPLKLSLKVSSNLEDTYSMINNKLSKITNNIVVFTIYPKYSHITSIVLEPKKFGNYSVIANADYNNTIVEENESNNVLTMNYEVTTKEKIPIKTGWNLISVPYYATVEIPNSVDIIYTYESSNWTQITNNNKIVPLYGYFIHSTENTEVNITFKIPQPGVIAPPQRTFDKKGWYLVGVNPNEYTDGWKCIQNNQYDDYSTNTVGYYGYLFQRVRGAVAVNDFVAPLGGSWSIIITDNGAYTNGNCYNCDECSPNLYAYKGYWLFMRYTGSNILAGRSTH